MDNDAFSAVEFDKLLSESGVMPVLHDDRPVYFITISKELVREAQQLITDEMLSNTSFGL